MDPRTPAGNDAHSTSRYTDPSQSNQDYAPTDGRRRSFSERAGQQLPGDLQEDRRANRQATRTSQQPVLYDRPPRDDMRRMREPQAALHVPKPRPRERTGPNDEERHEESSRYAEPAPRQVSTHKASVPYRSPLQALEGKLGDITKEEKRARMEEAEHRARQRSARDQSRRVPTEPLINPNRSRRTAEADDPGRSRNDKRHVSAPMASKTVEDEGPQMLPEAQSSSGAERTAYDRPSENGHDRFRRASQALRSRDDQYNDTPANVDHSKEPVREREREPRPQEAYGVNRSNSKGYRHRSRDAGFAGAAAAISGAAFDSESTERDSRRRSNDYARSQQDNIPRSNSKRIQKKDLPVDYQTGTRETGRIPAGQQQLQSNRMGTVEGIEAAAKYQEPDPLPRSDVRNPRGNGPTYQVPPQTAAGQDARDQVGFGGATITQSQGNDEHKHHKPGALLDKHHDHQPQQYQSAPPLDEWRNGGIARLELDDLAINSAVTGGPDADPTWGEQGSRGGRNSSFRRDGARQYDGVYEEEATTFRPQLLLKCGPLLRYTGMRRERRSQKGSTGVTEREIWRGTIMIVTDDRHSSYERTPILRLFSQPMELLPPPPMKISGQLPSEQVDPLAGQSKLSRTGHPLYVRPADALEEGVDLSRTETDDGLFERNVSSDTRHTTRADDQRRSNTSSHQSRIRARDGEKAGKYREVKGVRLHAERGYTFWRFSLEIELGTSQARVAYRINRGPATGFWVPGRGQTMNIMFHSCNGFSLSVDPHQFSGPDPLWRDVLTMHQSRPFHVMLGGGDQIYNDAATRDTKLFGDWLHTKNPEHKHRAEFSPAMQDELEEFYLERYCMWFSQGLFGMANSQIPMINIWDDHDIIDGYGSYPHHFMSSKIFTGLGAVAYKYYMLFQHQSTSAETYREEPSWLLGASPGPYINEYSRSVFMFLGRKVAFLGLDCRTERMRDEVLSQQSYDLVFNRCRAEIIKGETKHLIVLLGVPIAYPRLNFLENILTSRMMDPVKAIGRAGILGGFVNKFDGGVEILDDLDDHWTAKHHKQERNWLIQELQELASEKSVRITILGGDVHLGAVGQFYTPKKFGVPKDRDHRYMPNVISSAIVNTPPPTWMSDVLNKRNRVHHLDADTDEDMIPMFDYDVDGRFRKNVHLLPRRNYCTIREYRPGETPPPSPGTEQRPGSSRSQTYSGGQPADERDRRFPPGSMGGRSRSLTRSNFRPRSLLRRLSGSRTRSDDPPTPLTSDQIRAYEDAEPVQQPYSVGGHPRRPQNEDGTYFPQVRPSSSSAANPAVRSTSSSAVPVRPISMFHRRPTDLSKKDAAKAAAKGGAEANLGYIDLEGGLDVTINMEIDQHDPSGNTVGYRLLVPALFYGGPGDENTTRFKTRRASIMDRFRGRGRRGSMDSHSGSSSRSRSPSPEQRYANSRPMSSGNRAQAPPPPNRDGADADENPRQYNTRRPSLIDRMRGRNRSRSPEQRHTGNGQILDGNSAQAAPAPSRDGAEMYQNPRPVNIRRPSLLDRIRGLSRRRSMDSYSGSSVGSRSPSPERDHIGARLVSHGNSAQAALPESRRVSGPRHSGQAPYTDGTTEQARRDHGPPQALPNPAYRNTSASMSYIQPQSPSTPKTQNQPQDLSNRYYRNSSNSNSHPPPQDPSYRDHRNRLPSDDYGTNHTAPLSPKEDDMDRYEKPRKPGLFSRLSSFKRRPREHDDEGYGREDYGNESEGEIPEDEMTLSEIESMEARERPRRQSKAERFFGIGDDKQWGGGGRGGRVPQGQQQQQRRASGDDQGPGWKIWR